MTMTASPTSIAARAQAVRDVVASASTISRADESTHLNPLREVSRKFRSLRFGIECPSSGVTSMVPDLTPICSGETTSGARERNLPARSRSAGSERRLPAQPGSAREGTPRQAWPGGAGRSAGPGGRYECRLDQAYRSLAGSEGCREHVVLPAEGRAPARVSATAYGRCEPCRPR